MLIGFINIWRSLLVVSSWIGAIAGLICLLSKSGAGFLIGLILLTFAVGGFFAAHLIKRWMTSQMVVNLDKGVVTTTPLHRDIDGNEWTVINGRLYVRDSKGNFVPFQTPPKEA